MNIKSRNKLFLRAMELAMRVNSETKHHVQCSFQGHVDNLEILIYLGGWQSGKPADHDFGFTFGDENVKSVKQAVKVMEELLG